MIRPDYVTENDTVGDEQSSDVLDRMSEQFKSMTCIEKPRSGNLDKINKPYKLMENSDKYEARNPIFSI